MKHKFICGIILPLILFTPIAYGQAIDGGNGITLGGFICDTIIPFYSDELPYCRIGHDTLREYIKIIAEKCDTIWDKGWAPYRMFDGKQTYEIINSIKEIKCHVDTTWANKIEIMPGLLYVLPKEADKFKIWFLEKFVH